MLDIRDETAPLTDLCVCRGTAVPPCEGFEPDHPEFDVFVMKPWDREKLLRQQDAFYAVMERHGVRLHFLAHTQAHPWAMYTRDTGFVVGDTLYYAPDRQLPERVGEIDTVTAALPGIKTQAIPARIEGGDVLPDGDMVFVGMGTRTVQAGVDALAGNVDAQVIAVPLGPRVMHLDCRMTILPGRRLLTYTGDFTPETLALLRARFTLIEVTREEALAMGTNVFVVNPDTVVMHSGFPRLIAAVQAAGLTVEAVDWSEPNALLGSFRCATMPLCRAY